MGQSFEGYVGCYLDTADRQLNGTYANWLPHNNPQKCEDYCAIDNYKYFALQNAHQCFCGYVLNSSDRKAEKECDHDCPGDTTKKCGSQWRNSLYQRR